MRWAARRFTEVLAFVAGALFLFDPVALSAAQNNVPPNLRQVIVVFKTHFDIGYTDMASNVVQRYRTTMVDQALEVVTQNRNLAPAQQFVWTLPGWPMHKLLEDWPGQLPLRKQGIEQALREGRFVMHALPFTTHTALLEPEDLVRGLGYSSGLARRLGLALPRDAKMTDVPEHSWGMATLLHHAGVKFFFIGCNDICESPRVPPLFWWEGPDGSRLLTMYATKYGTQLLPPPDWPYHTWLALLHTGDNHGPPRPEEVKAVLDTAAQKLPGIQVRIGRLSDFGDTILAEKAELPVVRGDTPDTWIHGLMADPDAARTARHTRPLIGVTESLNTQLHAWGVDVADAKPAVAAAYEQSLLHGEHTWGGSSGWIGRQAGYGESFLRDRAAGRFQRLEASWDEHSAYIQTAEKLIVPQLAQNLKALAAAVNTRGCRIVVYNPLPWERDGWVSLDSQGATLTALTPVDGDNILPVATRDGQLQFFARNLPPMGYRTYVAAAGSEAPPALPPGGGNTLESPFFKATLDPARGVVCSLVEKRTQTELVDTSSLAGLGQYLYERFSSNQVRSYCSTYLRAAGRDHPSFLRLGLTPTEQCPYVALSLTNFQLRFEAAPGAVVAVMEARATPRLPAVTTRLILSQTQPCADLETTLHDKPLESWPEAGWLCLPFKVREPQFHLSQLASIINPAQDIIPGANRYIFALNSGLAVADPAGRGVGLCPLDAPLVSLGQPGCWKYSLDYVPTQAVVYLNLFNNQWNTNFRLWNQGTWTSRVRLWAFDHYQAESALVTPALEARFPLQAALGVGAPGNLPPARTGLEVSGKGVLVTALGHNPDGPGWVLRLWEYAGIAGVRQVRLPAGIEPKVLQPVNLRGEPAGEPIPVRNRSFSFNLGAFAPASFVFQ